MLVLVVLLAKFRQLSSNRRPHFNTITSEFQTGTFIQTKGVWSFLLSLTYIGDISHLLILTNTIHVYAACSFLQMNGVRRFQQCSRGTLPNGLKGCIKHVWSPWQFWVQSLVWCRWKITHTHSVKIKNPVSMANRRIINFRKSNKRKLRNDLPRATRRRPVCINCQHNNV